MADNGSKQSAIVEFLRTEEGVRMIDAEIADRFVTSEGTVRRARKVIEAEGQRDALLDRGVDPHAVHEILTSILAADAVEETIQEALEELDEERKELKASLKSAADHSRSVRRSARENHPLFEKPGGSAPKEKPAEKPIGLADLSEAV